MVTFALWACVGPSSDPSLPSPQELEEDVPMEILPVEVPDPTPELLLAIAADRSQASSLVDVARGFVVVDVFNGSDDPRADAKGRLRVAERVCGDQAVARATELAEELATLAGSGPEVFRCAGAVCTHAATDALPHAGSYAFQAPDGKQVLSVVVRMGPVGKAAAVQRRIEGWVDNQLRRLASESCHAVGNDGGEGPGGGAGLGSEATPPDPPAGDLEGDVQQGDPPEHQRR